MGRRALGVDVGAEGKVVGDTVAGNDNDNNLQNRKKYLLDAFAHSIAYDINISQTR